MTGELEQVSNAKDELERVIKDDSLPNNIKSSLKRAKEHLEDDDKDASERAAIAINVLNDIADNPNLPMHTRTKIWNITGSLEKVTME